MIGVHAVMLLVSCVIEASVPAVHLRDGSRLEAQSIEASPEALTVRLGEQETVLGWHRVRAIGGWEDGADGGHDAWLAAGTDIWRGLSRLDRGDVVAAGVVAERAFPYVASDIGPTSAAASVLGIRHGLLTGERARAMRAWASMVRASNGEPLPENVNMPAFDAEHRVVIALPPVWVDPDDAGAALLDLQGDIPVLVWFAHLARRQAGESSERPESLDGMVGTLLSAGADGLAEEVSLREMGRSALRDLAADASESDDGWIGVWASMLMAQSYRMEIQRGSRDDAMRAVLSMLQVDALAASVDPNLTVLALVTAFDISRRTGLGETTDVLRAEIESRFGDHPLARAGLLARTDSEGSE